MRSRTITGSLLVLASLGVFGASGTAAPAVKWAAVNLTETTLIAGAFVSGPVVFVHDDERMARGEPCTSVHRLDAVKGLGDHILAGSFLAEFIENDTPWVHVDLAASNHKGGLAHVPTEVTGFGVRYTLGLVLDDKILEDDE